MPDFTKKIDFAFDSCAIRHLTRLSGRQFSAAVRQVRRRQLVGGWVPWCVGEVAGSNLNRKSLSLKDLRDLQLAADRYDKLVNRKMLHELDYYFKRQAFVVAGQKSPPEPSDCRKGQRRGLDFFLALKEPKQVVVRSGKGMEVNYLAPNGRPRWRVDVPTHFGELSVRNVEKLKGHFGGTKSRKLSDLARAASGWYVPWLRATVGRLGLPDDVVEALVVPLNFDALGNTVLASGLVEAFYYARRASGVKTSADENDGADVYFACYLFVASILVTDDGPLRSFLRDLVEDSTRIMGLEEFLEWLGVDHDGLLFPRKGN